MVVPSKAWPKVWASAAHVRPRLTVDTPRTLLIAAIRAFSEVRHIAAYRRLRRHSAVEAVGGRSVAFAIAATGCLDGSAHISRRQSKASHPDPLGFWLPVVDLPPRSALRLPPRSPDGNRPGHALACPDACQDLHGPPHHPASLPRHLARLRRPRRAAQRRVRRVLVHLVPHPVPRQGPHLREQP